MTNLNDILSLLGGQPLKSRFVMGQNLVVDKVEFLSVVSELRDHTAYITTEAALEEELKEKAVSPRSIVICGVEDDLVREHDLPPVNILFFKMDAMNMFTALNRRMREYGQWQIKLSDCVHEHGTFAAVAETCAEIATSPVFIVNADRQIVAYAGVEYSPMPYAQRLAKAGQLHDNLYAYPGQVLHEGQRGLQFERTELSKVDGLLLHLWRSSRDGKPMYALLVEQSAASRIMDMDMLAYYVSISIFKVRERFSIPRETTKFSFQTVMSDVLSGQVSQEELIESRFENAGIRIPESHVYRLILAEPERGGCDLVGFNTALEEALPGGGSYGYRGKTLYLWPVSGEMADGEMLEKVFREFGYFGIVGDAARSRNLRMQHKVLAQALRLRGHAYWLKHRAVCYYDEVRFLSMVDILYTAVPRFYGVAEQDAVRQIVSPAVERLYMYDKENNTQLRNVLRIYLATNCSLSETAARLYMHKNTVAYKIKQINGITGGELCKSASHTSLLMSCAILDYLEN